MHSKSLRPILTPAGVSCDFLKKSEIAELTDILAKCFVEKEPLSLSLKIPQETMALLFATIVDKTFDDGVCLVCKNNEGRIIGGTICYDLFREIDLSNQPHSLSPIISLLDRVTNLGLSSLGVKKFSKGEGLEIFATGVDPEYAEKGIGKWLIDTASIFFANLGYKYSITQSTSPITQSLRVQCGFCVLALIEYNDFEWESKKPFYGINFDEYKTSIKLFKPGRGGAALLMKNLLW